jgi:ribosomal protein S18 acetylase RimI-like enzyme
MTDSNLEIRQLREMDTESFRNLRLRGLKEHPEAFLAAYEEESSTPVEAYAARLGAATPDNFYLGAFVACELAGIAHFERQVGIKVRHRAYIGAMYVPPERRGLGIGRALLEHALQHARTLPGLEEVGLWVMMGNDRAQALYEAMGFVTFCIEPRAIRVDGRYYDAAGMILRL